MSNQKPSRRKFLKMLGVTGAVATAGTGAAVAKHQIEKSQALETIKPPTDVTGAVLRRSTENVDRYHKAEKLRVESAVKERDRGTKVLFGKKEVTTFYPISMNYQAEVDYGFDQKVGRRWPIEQPAMSTTYSGSIECEINPTILRMMEASNKVKISVGGNEFEAIITGWEYMGGLNGVSVGTVTWEGFRANGSEEAKKQRVQICRVHDAFVNFDNASEPLKISPTL